MKRMAKEGRLRKLHRRDWPGFLKRVVPDRLWQRVNRCVNRTSDPKRTLVLQARSPVLDRHGLVDPRAVDRAVSRELRTAFLHVLPTPSLRRSAFGGLTQATRRVGMTVFADFWCCLRQTIAKRVGTAWTWYGWTVFAVDGSRVDAPRTRRNERTSGKAGRDKTHSQWGRR